jgi:DNA-binding NarL/FixJ family response regulator
VNKAADQYEVLDGRTRAETTARAEPARATAARTGGTATRATPARRRRPHRERPSRSWSKPQQELARIRNARGMRPDEIARELGLSTGTVIEMLLAARNGH